MEEQRELTILFYFASDNPLAPLVVSELKAIKDAGFQRHTSVLVYFDPMEKGAPTQLLDVNHKQKEKGDDKIGDGNDPFVRNMCEDEIDISKLDPAFQAGLKGDVEAVKSLGAFLDFGISERPAKNYILFLIGHGMIVGNDAFLPDDDPVSAITLVQLKDLLGKFEGKSLQLLGLHSCSMSSVEVVYQLKGQANYLLATQGTTFVNGWPYRQMLKKALNQVKKSKDHAREVTELQQKSPGQRPEEEIQQEIVAAVNAATVNYDELIKKLYFLCLFNFTDFMTAGYSCDLTLCRLDPERLEALKKPLQDLVVALKAGLTKPVGFVEESILLAHWEAQSFWGESYTDLWDFCDRLADKCRNTAKVLKLGDDADPTATELLTLAGLCEKVQETLADNGAQQSQGIVRYAENFGSQFQFAHGLSIYFPWCEPLDDQRAVFESQDETEKLQREAKHKTVLENYKEYDFTKEFGDDSWLSFLGLYFKETKREARFDFADGFFARVSKKRDQAEIKEAFASAEAAFTAGVLKRTPELERKRTPEEGPECTCPTIKNYPTQRIDSSWNVRRFSITPRALRAFLPIEEDDGDNDNNEN